MTDRHHSDPTEREPLTEQDLAIAALVGRYVERREREKPMRPRPARGRRRVRRPAVDALRTVLACYEAMRASDDRAR